MKKKRRPQTAEEFAPIAQIGGKALDLGVIRESDVNRYAQRLAAAKTDVARGDVMNEWFKKWPDGLRNREAGRCENLQPSTRSRTKGTQ